MKNKSPAFQFYASDFLTGTAMMSAEEAGTYIRLLCFQFDSGFLPNDERKLTRLAGAKVSAEVRAKFTLGEDGLLRNDRLEKERVKQRQFAESRRLNADSRWKRTDASASPMHPFSTSKNGADASVMHEASRNGADAKDESDECINDALQSSSSSPSSEEEKERIGKRRTPCPQGAEEAAAVAEAWNGLGKPFPQVQKLSEGRRKVLRQRLKDDWWRDNFRLGLAQMPQSKFLSGQNERGWVADFDFFIRPDTLVKLREGRYHERGRLEEKTAAEKTDCATWNPFVVSILDMAHRERDEAVLTAAVARLRLAAGADFAEAVDWLRHRLEPEDFAVVFRAERLRKIEGK